MWCQREWIQPTQRRFRTVMTLAQTVATQELTGTQTRIVEAWGCTGDEVNTVLRASENTVFVDGLQHTMQEQIHFGLDCFSISGQGQRKTLPEDADPGSYTYQTVA